MLSLVYLPAVLVMISCLSGCGAARHHQPHSDTADANAKAKYIFLFIGDGMGASLTVLVSAEPYWCNFSKDSFALYQKCRIHAGFNIKLLDNLTFTPQYAYQTYHSRAYDDHIIYVTFQVKL